MQNNNLPIINAQEEILAAVRQYFNRYGLVEGEYAAVSEDGCGTDCDYTIYLDGAIDSFRLVINYNNFKPERIVTREVLALDERITSINVVRKLKYDEFDIAVSNLEGETIYIEQNGKLVRTTLYDYVMYSVRNIDYTKKRNGRMA